MKFNQNQQNYAQVPGSSKSWRFGPDFTWSWQYQVKPMLGPVEVLSGFLVQLGLAQARFGCWRNFKFLVSFWRALLDRDFVIILKIMSQGLQTWPMHMQRVVSGALDIADHPPARLGSWRPPEPIFLDHFLHGSFARRFVPFFHVFRGTFHDFEISSNMLKFGSKIGTFSLRYLSSGSQTQNLANAVPWRLVRAIQWWLLLMLALRCRRASLIIVDFHSCIFLISKIPGSSPEESQLDFLRWEERTWNSANASPCSLAAAI